MTTPSHTGKRCGHTTRPRPFIGSPAQGVFVQCDLRPCPGVAASAVPPCPIHRLWSREHLDRPQRPDRGEGLPVDRQHGAGEAPLRSPRGSGQLSPVHPLSQCFGGCRRGRGQNHLHPQLQALLLSPGPTCTLAPEPFRTPSSTAAQCQQDSPGPGQLRLRGWSSGEGTA